MKQAHALGCMRSISKARDDRLAIHMFGVEL